MNVYANADANADANVNSNANNLFILSDRLRELFGSYFFLGFLTSNNGKYYIYNAHSPEHVEELANPTVTELVESVNGLFTGIYGNEFTRNKFIQRRQIFKLLGQIDEPDRWRFGYRHDNLYRTGKLGKSTFLF